jgi:putative transposase
MIRKVTKSKGAFTSDMAMLKIVYLATVQFKKKCKKNISNWSSMANQICFYFEDRIMETDTVQ